MEIAHQEYTAGRMEEVCYKLMREYGKTTYEEDAKICREGQELINRAVRANKKGPAKHS